MDPDAAGEGIQAKAKRWRDSSNAVLELLAVTILAVLAWRRDRSRELGLQPVPTADGALRRAFDAEKNTRNGGSSGRCGTHRKHGSRRVHEHWNFGGRCGSDFGFEPGQRNHDRVSPGCRRGAAGRRLGGRRCTPLVGITPSPYRDGDDRPASQV